MTAFEEALELNHQLENQITELSASMQVREAVPGRRLQKLGKVQETAEKMHAALRRDAREKGTGK